MTASTVQSTALLRGSKYFCIVLAPAAVLAVVLLLSGIRAGLPPAGTALLLAGLGVVPGIVFKGTKGFFRSRGLADHWRTDLVTVLMLAGTVICYLVPVPDPVPATAAALMIGNAGLAFFRRWLNVSAHVSVLTFGVLWTLAVFGSGFAWLLLLLPLMCFTRVSLREHTHAEVLAGTAWGLGTFGFWQVLQLL
ncbi:hypothetical protein [Arthrobacter koreensis]|uniref:hypothetical protein n=1 Tax=Arthrobacter koreensis TaxID=199136 RepID=UPI00382ECEEE